MDGSRPQPNERQIESALTGIEPVASDEYENGGFPPFLYSYAVS